MLMEYKDLNTDYERLTLKIIEGYMTLDKI